MVKTTCCKCGEPNDRLPQKYCKKCHATHMRLSRPKHSDLSPEAKEKANRRAYANVAQLRGRLTPKPCETCGSDDAEKHHEDYDKPLEVTWLCRTCHLARHRVIDLERHIQSLPLFQVSQLKKAA